MLSSLWNAASSLLFPSGATSFSQNQHPMSSPPPDLSIPSPEYAFFLCTPLFVFPHEVVPFSSSPVSSPPRAPKKGSEEWKKKKSERIDNMDAEACNYVLLAIHDVAMKNIHRQGRERPSADECLNILEDVAEQTGLVLSWDAFRRRIHRLQGRATLARTPGSGAPFKFSSKHLQATYAVSMKYGGKISRRDICEEVTVSAPVVRNLAFYMCTWFVSGCCHSW